MEAQPTKRKRSPFKKFLIYLSIIIVLVLLGYGYWRYFFTYSEGNRTGLLQKFSRKGTLFKTYEGELVLSSIKSTSDVSIASEKFFFSVNDKELAKKMMGMEGQRVILHYQQKNAAILWRGDTPYMVDSVRVLQ
jgi:hypothetical protein